LPNLVLPSQKNIPAEVQLETLAQELATPAIDGCEKALISWEGFVGIKPETIAKLAHALGDRQVSVLAYLRDQISLYQAAALKTLEMHGFVTDSVFFGSGEISAHERELYDFNATLSKWKEAFRGRAEIRTRWFDRALLKEGDVVTDFLSWLDLAPDAEFVLETRTINRTIDSNAAALILLARSLRLPQKELTRLTGALLQLNSGGGQKTFLNFDAQQRIYQIFKDSNERLLRDHRPENLPEQHAVLLPPNDSQSSNSPVFEYIAKVRAELKQPEILVWDGGVLHSKVLQQLTRPPGRGWRAVGAGGVWSMGRHSQLSFKLPKLNQLKGPSHLRISFRGEYAQGHSSTLVVVNEKPNNALDLRKAELEIAITEELKENGVHLRLDHQFQAKQAQDEQAQAFQLQEIFYYFLWM
ncbi:MAG: hypothetical protein AAGF35_14280, partial [Pseudomonadota bacterium]